MASDPKLHKWGPKGMLVAKKGDKDEEVFIEKADLGIFGGAGSKVVKALPGYAWGKEGMKAGTKYARNSDVIALFAPEKPAPVQPPVVAKAITSLTVQNLGALQTNVPVTVGQVFAVGDLPAGMALTARNSSGTAVPLQMDVKATHADGSVRHAILTMMFEKFTPGDNVVDLLKGGTPSSFGTALGPYGDITTLERVEVVVYGVKYFTNGRVFQSKDRKEWLAGRIVREFQVSAPLLNSETGDAHPHLSARLVSRIYESPRDAKRERFEIVIENNWAYEPNPQNFTYDVEIIVAGKTVYEQKALTHLHHARWRKVFWIGEEPRIHVKHDAAYLIASKALPNYDRSIVYSEKRLDQIGKKFNEAMLNPMSIGATARGMSSTGGRADIGILPGWDVDYLLTQDPRAWRLVEASANGSGSWPIHYRNKETDRPVTLVDFPYMTIMGRSGDTKNPNRIDPVTGKKGVYEKFPDLVKDKSEGGYSYDVSHHPQLCYLAYLVTGDYFYLEELQFTAAYISFQTNPGFRKNIHGLLARQQVRGQAWSMRTLLHAAYITPDSDPVKGHLVQLVENNIQNYLDMYPNNPEANKLGVADKYYALIYMSKRAIAGWQDDMLTAAFGLAFELGFDSARPLLEWKAKFVRDRMSHEARWLGASPYNIVLTSAEGAPLFETPDEVFEATFGKEFMKLKTEAEVATFLGLKPGEMEGRGGYELGYPANSQPALSYAVRADSPEWKRFADRTIKPDYSYGPQWAIIPR